MKREPRYKHIASDFLSRCVVTDQDVCLDFNPTPASEILEKRVNLREATDNTDVISSFGLCVGLEQPNFARMMKLARRCYFWIPAKRPMWKYVKAIEAKRGRILHAEQSTLGYTIYATAYISMDDLEELSVINVTSDAVEHNIRTNLSKGYREVEPHGMQIDAEVVVVLGGPSINDFADQIYAQAKSGIPVITANGAYNWCLDRKIIPAAQVLCDARAFNVRFVKPAHPQTKFLLCSQCDPGVLEAVPKDQLWMWHAYSDLHNKTIKDYFGEEKHVWYPIPGGTCVGLRLFPLLLMLGYKNFHVYGLDSCVMDTHHGYVQHEDDSKRTMIVECEGRKFICYPWMAHQYHDFLKLTKHLIGPLCQMEIYGDGLIAHCVRTLGAEDGSNEMDGLQPREIADAHWEHKFRQRHAQNAPVQEWSQP